jgi:glycine/D-amino acid oxidase-like deaminating enzyme
MAAAPLAPGYADAPLWWENGVLPPDRPERPLPSEVGTVVVGGGYTGVAAARELARRGTSVLVLDKGPLGRGASSRNAGFAHPGLKVPLATLLSRHGDLGRRLYDESVRAFELLESTVQTEAIDCEWERNGFVVCAAKPAHVERLERNARLYRDELEEEARFVPRDELAGEVGSAAFHGALVLPRAASLQPAKFFAGLLRSAEAAGAELQENVAVTGVERRGAGFAVATERGTVLAQRVLVATNGYTDGAFPELRRRVIPIGSYLLTTEPLPPVMLSTIAPKRRTFIDSKNFLYAWKLTGDRLMFGGRTSFRKLTFAEARDRMYAAMVSVFPQLRGVRVDHAWGGLVGFTYDRLPHVGRADGLAYSLGYCGSGVVLSVYLGTQTAAWLEGDEAPAFTQLPFPTVPLYRGRPWFLPLVGWYYGLVDRCR